MGQEDLLFKLGIDASGIGKGITSVRDQVRSGVSSIASSFTQMFAVAAVVASLRDIGKEMVELRSNAKQFEVGTDFLQAWRRGIVKFGGSIEEADKSIDKLLQKIGDARENGGDAAASFEKLGISLGAVGGNAATTEDVLKQIANKYQAAATAADKARIAHEFFGKSGEKAAKILAGGAAGIDAYIKNLKEAGNITAAENVDRIADSFLRLNSTMSQSKALAANFFGDFIEASNYAAEWIGLRFDTIEKKARFLASIVVNPIGAAANLFGNSQENRQATDDANLLAQDRERELHAERDAQRAQQAKKDLETLARLASEYATALSDTNASRTQMRINQLLGEEVSLRARLLTLTSDRPISSGQFLRDTVAESNGRLSALRQQQREAVKNFRMDAPDRGEQSALLDQLAAKVAIEAQFNAKSRAQARRGASPEALELSVRAAILERVAKQGALEREIETKKLAAMHAEVIAQERAVKNADTAIKRQEEELKLQQKKTAEQNQQNKLLADAAKLEMRRQEAAAAFFQARAAVRKITDNVGTYTRSEFENANTDRMSNPVLVDEVIKYREAEQLKLEARRLHNLERPDEARTVEAKANRILDSLKYLNPDDKPNGQLLDVQKMALQRLNEIEANQGKPITPN